MPKLAVDIDNTLYSFEAAARRVYLQLAEELGDESLFRGAYNPWQEWRSMADVCGEIYREVIVRVHSGDVVLAQKPYEDAVAVMREVANEHEITYISNRDPDSYNPTKAWLHKHAFPPGELICTFEDKIPLLNQFQYLIDDRPKTLVQFVYNYTWRYSNGPSKARKAFGMAFPYNQALTDIPGLSLAPAWCGIRHYLQKKGVI